MQTNSPRFSTMQNRFLNSTPHNYQTLQRVSMNSFCQEMPDFANLLMVLKEKGFFKNVDPIDFDINKYLNASTIATANLEQTAYALVHAPLTGMMDKPISAMPDEFLPLKDKIEYYIKVICDVLNNQLADKNYERNLPTSENVSEREHALQAAKIAFLLGMEEGDVLALLFHDISRPTHEDQRYGDKHHCGEGSDILKPLGLPVDYCLLHAFAKYVLVECSRTYRRELISPVSSQSLSDQESLFQSQLASLQSLSSQELAQLMYKIILMRIMDDFSKVPTAHLGVAVEYFTDDMIKQMLTRQIYIHLHDLTVVYDDTDKMLAQFELNLESALTLLERPKAFSNHPELYQVLPSERKGNR